MMRSSPGRRVMIRHCSDKLGCTQKVCSKSPHLHVVQVMQLRIARAFLLTSNSSVHMKVLVWISFVLFSMQTKPHLFFIPICLIAVHEHD